METSYQAEKSGWNSSTSENGHGQGWDIRLLARMGKAFPCPPRATAGAMEACTFWDPTATIGRPRPTVRRTRGTSTSFRAACTRTAAAVAVGDPSDWSKIDDCACKSAIARHPNHCLAI